jgi:predicted phosphate transport protein (TIGR00153 family)
MGDLLVKSASEFNKLLHDLPNQQHYVDIIASYEEEADRIAHTTFQRIHKTFITPFDRNDIHKLTSGLDDILDQVNRCAQRFPFYDLKTVPDEIIHLADLTLAGSLALKNILSHLHSLKKADEILKYCDKIDSIESEAHQMVLTGEKNLFLHENHFKQFLKLKEIYSRTKLVIDALQDVANIIKGIVLEYS